MSFRTSVPLFGLIFSLAVACVTSTASPKDTGDRVVSPFQRRAAKRKPVTKRGTGRSGAAGSVRLDALAIPAGYMSGRGNPESIVSQGGEPGKCGERAGCVRFVYRHGSGWGGIMWWPPACGPDGEPSSWEKAKYNRCGIDVGAAGGLRSVHKLSFFAKGERGGEIVEFKVGAADIQPSPAHSTGRLVLKAQWTRYEIDLRDVVLSSAASLFTWVAADDANPGGAIFYLDEIRFEGVK